MEVSVNEVGVGTRSENKTCYLSGVVDENATKRLLDAETGKRIV